MTTNLNKTITHINNALFAAKMQNIIQYMYEDELEKAIRNVFHQMREEILANLEEYYGDILFNAHLDLILAPIHEHHRDYYNAIKKYKLREHRKGRVQGKRLVNRAKQYAKQYSKNYYGGAVKADTLSMNSIIKKDELYATSEFGSQQMIDKTFVASENTLARVDSDINQVITEGYQNGWGIKDVGNRIEKRFDQLETWEARRIARTEIHGSHMQGVLKSYEDMDVEYLQWGAAHDNRTRDTHIELDGEIIPFGGVFSNGLRYPGDTSGPLSEFINCRCGVLPWFCPPGMMVPPGMTNFRESDLITTLDNWNKPKEIDLNSKFTKYTTKDGRSTINVRETKNPSEFLKYLNLAKQSQPITTAWRVEVHKLNEYKELLDSGGKLFITERGSTLAITGDGDIISVCSNIDGLTEILTEFENTKLVGIGSRGGLKDNSRALLEFATENGGIKLDSFEGNYGFYRRCGFEPISSCKFNTDPDIAPDEWIKGHAENPLDFKKENVIFFEYTGKQSPYETEEDFYSVVKPLSKDDYFTAQEIRDNIIRRHLNGR